MTCDQAELRMAELLAGEIAPEERAALDRHLLDCAACRADFQLARAGARIEWADVSVPREVIESTLASFREPGPAVRLLRWATAAAAVFGVVALLLTSSRAPQKPAESLAVACTTERPQVLATMQEAVVGALVCKDEEGRPVGELSLKSHEVSVEILDGIAKTTVEENFENHTDRRLEGTFHFPLPSDASISRLALEVNGKIEEGTCLERERAREVFESIVRKAMDPALLEWQPGGFFKCRVFPIEPRATKRVIVAYTQALPCFQGKMTYVYPLASEKTRTHPPGEASVAVQARFSGGLAKIASPSHHLEVQRKDATEASMAFRAANYRPNNDFVVTMEPGDEEVRVVSHKTDGDDGYFACFATPKGGGARVPAKYAFVLDASASISAPRLEVARRLVRAMMERRIEGDRFEILAHNVEVERSGDVDLRAANDFMDRLRPIGGSDVLKALLAAGDAEVVYIGKGSATFGETEPSRILEAVKGRRIRTIAVGSDANGTLLERLGGMMRVNPNDDVGKRVEEIAATLGAPVLSGVTIDGGEAVYDVVGVRDFFYGERLIASGRYRGPAAKLVISGTGYRREIDVAFPAKEEGNNYVRRLWAQRKVSDLLAQGPAKKPEVTELGVKYQIMTPYTSFLVLETEQMWKDYQLKREVQKQDTVLSVEDKTRGLMEEAVVLYKKGKAAEASAKFEQAFELKPTGDQVYAFLRRSGEDVVGRMINDPDRKAQDAGRRLMELAKPGEPLRTGKVMVPPAPTVAPPRNIPRDPEPRTGKSTDIPDQEDPKARAIREAYEEQLRRDRQEVVLNMKNGSGNDEIIEEFRRQRGWNLVVEGRGAATEYDKFMKEALVRRLSSSPSALNPETESSYRPATNQFGGLEFLLDVDERWGALPQRVREGLMEGRRIETYSIQPFERWDQSKIASTYWMDNGEAPGAPITDALPLEIDSLELVAPTAGGRGPTNGGWRTSGGGGGNSDPEKLAKLMEVRAIQLKHLAPPAAYTAKIEPGKTLQGRPLEPLNQDLLMRWTLAHELEGQLTKDVNGRTLGKLNYDPQSNSFIVRDTPAAQERVAKVLEALDGPNGSGELEKLVKMRDLQDSGGNNNVAPRKAVTGQVTAVSKELNLVVISVGKDDGVLEGDEFSINRGTDFVAKIIVDRTEPKWSSGKIIHRKGEPAIADQATNQLFVAGFRMGELASCTAGLEVVSLEEDGRIRLRASGGGISAHEFCAVTRDLKFVAMVRIAQVSGTDVYGRTVQGLEMGRVLPGDRADRVADLRAYLASLPLPVRQDLSSRANQQAIRAKMGLKQ